MSADSFFVIGKSHEICEDYATDGVFSEKYPYAIVCDGCSSSEKTDFGARLLSKAIEKNMLWLFTFDEDIKFTSNRYINDAKMFSDIMNLDNGALNSTALLAFKTESNYQAHIYGDGVVVAKTKSGYDVFIIDFPSGAPGYISYALDVSFFTNYSNTFGLQRKIHKHKLDNNFNIIEEETCCESLPFTDPLIPHIITYPKEECDFIAIFSDGIQSFYKTEISEASKVQKIVNMFGILKLLLSFKGMQGKFVKRRFKRFMKEIKNLEWENFDDVSLGVVS